MQGGVNSERPNLFIVGAPKCGTTAWVSYLSAHPDVWFTEVKEPNYFAFDLPGIRRYPTLHEYETLFRRGRDHKVRGEASTLYLYSAASAQAIRAYDPGAKIIIFLRDQEDFLPSWHQQLLFRFNEGIHDLEAAWRLSGDRPAATIPNTCFEPKMLDYDAVADFPVQVERYLDAFPREQILILRFEDWIREPRATYLRILDFLGLEDDGRMEFAPVYEARVYRVEWLGRLIARPPRIAQFAVNMLKKIVGRNALGLGRKASELASTRASSTRISPKLRLEIRSRYADGNRRLRERIDGKTPSADSGVQPSGRRTARQ